jgi:hypothetical protein
MKNDPQYVDAENVISVAFGEVPHDIAHPASKNFPEEIDDPLQELLDEANIPDDLSEIEEEHYIYAHQESWDYSMQMEQGLIEMSTTITDQLKRLKEDIKRLKYYLDEMNID